MIERDGFDPDRNFAIAGCGRRSDIGHFETTIIKKLQGAHEFILFKT